jgi:hypothetical protein
MLAFDLLFLFRDDGQARRQFLNLRFGLRSVIQRGQQFPPLVYFDVNFLELAQF